MGGPAKAVGEAIGVVRPKVSKESKTAKREAARLRREAEARAADEERRTRSRRRARVGRAAGRRLLTFAGIPGAQQTLGGGET